MLAYATCHHRLLLADSVEKWFATAEKYALEIEIFTLNRGFRAQVSHNCTQKRRFQQSVCGQPGRTDFFNRIGRSLPVVTPGVLVK